jgi:hypothetical protein
VREVLYDVQWQRLRISLLQARRDDGGWSSREGMEDNLRQLGDYIHKVDHGTTWNDREELELRRYRVNNALNAVVMGYNGQKADQSLIADVRKWRQEWAVVTKKNFVIVHARTWNWDVQLRQLITFFREDHEEFRFLQENLLRRSGNGTQKTRPELYKFLDLMQTAARV